ncbi:MAG TPA: protoporphyrinogen oxidase [Thermoanaerobaculia bacterium]|nr:protoporphyrinogen oxidase [Thermoanaerobaculia bacterium]
MCPDRLDTLIIGAGISGLTTAFWLRRAGLRVAVIEASPRAGGSIETWTEGPWRFEMGPNTVLESRGEVTRLLRESGLESEKIVAAPAGKRRFLWKRGRLHALPGGPPGFLKTRLFSTGAKLRLLKEPWIPRPPAGTEESIAQLVSRRLGPEFLRYAVGPFVSGVYAGDPERLSVRWAVPKIWSLEAEHGSLILGALKMGKTRRKGPQPGGAMFSFPQGLEELPRRLAREIGDVRTGVAAQRIVRGGEGYRVETSVGMLEAARIVLAVPTEAAARLLDEVTGGRSRLFAEIPYAAVAIVSLGYRRSDVAHALDGFGFLAPRGEGLRVLGCLFPSQIFPDRAPEGHVSLAAFLGGRTDPEIVGQDDAQILAAVEGDLRRALGVRGAPVLAAVRRWPRAIPQYELGHGRFVERAAEIERELPGLRIGGSFLRGVSVADCIKNATELAAEILRQPGAEHSVGAMEPLEARS